MVSSNVPLAVLRRDEVRLFRWLHPCRTEQAARGGYQREDESGAHDDLQGAAAPLLKRSAQSSKGYMASWRKFSRGLVGRERSRRFALS